MAAEEGVVEALTNAVKLINPEVNIQNNNDQWQAGGGWRHPGGLQIYVNLC